MRMSFIYHSILQAHRCKIQLLPYPSTSSGSVLTEKLHALICSHGSGYEFKLLGFNLFKPSQVGVNRTGILRPTATKTEQRTRDTEILGSSNLRHGFSNGTVSATTTNNLALFCYQSIRCWDSQQKILDSRNLKHSVKVNRTGILRPITTKTEQRSRETESLDSIDLRHGFSDGTARASTTCNSASSCIASIQCSDPQERIMESRNLKHPVKLFVIDLETTGICRRRGRIIEIAIRDLLGGKNSSFQTLVNPEQAVPNSKIHGITTKMVIHPHVPRMEDLIPILIQYIKSRLIPGGLALLAAHNGRCFDVPFLVKEFSRCGKDIPSDWWFLDTLSLARELMKLNGPKLSSRISLQALCEYYGIPLDGSDHRAMSDVNLLTSILERMTFDLKLTVADLLGRSFKASDLINNLKKSKRS